MTTAPKPQRNYREREHRVTELPVADILKTVMKDLGIKNIELQKALGFPNPNVIAMIKSGAMRLPVNMAIKTAEMLKLDKVAFLGKVVAENDPALWDSIESLLGKKLVSTNELLLIKQIREMSKGFDLNLAESPEWLQANAAVIGPVVEREKAIVEATKNRKDDEPKN